jgi:hypothetical protein
MSQEEIENAELERVANLKADLEATQYADMKAKFEELGIPDVWKSGVKKDVLILNALAKLDEIEKLKGATAQETEVNIAKAEEAAEKETIVAPEGPDQAPAVEETAEEIEPEVGPTQDETPVVETTDEAEKSVDETGEKPAESIVENSGDGAEKSAEPIFDEAAAKVLETEEETQEDTEKFDEENTVEEPLFEEFSTELEVNDHDYTLEELQENLDGIDACLIQPPSDTHRRILLAKREKIQTLYDAKLEKES